jgi:MFS family permease
MIATSANPVAQRPFQWSPKASAVLLTAILMSFLAAASAPTPLYSLYRESWGFSSGTLTWVFAVYAFSLLLALLSFGKLSDHIGRRPLVFAALLIELLAMLVFIAADSVGLLLLARILQGFATGLATSVLGATLLDIDRERGALINSVAPLFGLAVGALGSSLLMQFAPAPLHLVFVLLLAAFVLFAVLARYLPETVSRKPGAWASLRPSVLVPVQARRALWQVAPVDISLWALGGFYLSLGPTLARTVTGHDAPLIGGLLVFALMASGAVGIVLMRNQAARPVLLAGASALIVGLAVTLLGVHLGSPLYLYLGTAIAGFGFGVAFLGALRSVMPLAHAHERGGLMASFFILSYLAFALPALAAGSLTQHLGLLAATHWYGGVLILLASVALVGLLVRRD